MTEPLTQVLLIEDNPDQVEFLSQLLLQGEAPSLFLIRRAATLNEGLQLLAEGGFKLVLLDLSLPDSHGLETFVRVAEVAAEVAIVVMSNFDDVSLAVETVQLGAQDYLSKGYFDGHLLIRSMQYALERKRGQLQLKRAYHELEERVKERTGMLQQANARLQKEIAERKLAEAATLESNRQLASALSQLQLEVPRLTPAWSNAATEGLANRLETALGPVLGACQRLLSEPALRADPERVRELALSVQLHAFEGLEIVAELQGGAPPSEGIAFSVLLERALSAIEPRWNSQRIGGEPRIDIRREIQSVPPVPGDVSDLQAALENVLIHAIEGIPRRGTLTVAAGVCEGALRISVSDDGIGMSEELLAGALESGSRLEPVDAVMRRHSGRLEVQSEFGRGTTVTMVLPLSQAPAPLSVPAPEAAMRSLNILVVDDEPLVREVVSIYLSEDAHRISTACNGREGLEMFKAQPFDLVMTDRAMPEMDGEELAHAIKSLNPLQPIILLTGYGEDGMETRPEVDLVVQKPFTIEMLRGAILKTVGP